MDRDSSRLSLFAGRIQLGPYWFALLSALLGVVLRLLLDPWLGDTTPYLTFVISVALTGLYAGVRPALFTTALGAVLASFLFVPPRYKFGFAGMNDLVGFLLYLVTAFCIILLTRARNKSHEETARSLQARVLAERKVREAQKLLRVFLENWPGCAYLRNQKGQYVYYNKQAARVLGIDEEAARGEPELRSRLEGHDQTALAADSASTRFVDKVSLDGEERYWMTGKIRFTDEAENRFVGSLSADITSQVQAEQVAREGERLAAASQMVSMVAHEINNPLAALTNSFFLLGREPIPHRAQELVAVAQNELSRLTHVAKLAIGLYMQTEEADSLDPCGLVEDVLAHLVESYPDEHVQIQRDFKWKGMFVACAGRMHQVVESVLGNSVESDARHIRVRVERSRDWQMLSRTGLRISILDDGRGMKPHERKKAFEPFFSSRNDKGTGLGLWITKAVALRNGGHIAVRSTDCPRRHGTCVSVFFPERVPLTTSGSSANP